MRRIGLAIAFVRVWPAIAWAQSPTMTPISEEPRLTRQWPSFEEYTMTSARWLTAGPGSRTHLWGRRSVVEVSAAVSRGAPKIAHGRVEFPHPANGCITIGSKTEWEDFTRSCHSCREGGSS